ncbi:unnamed protein product [Rotaria sp. Silwood2]|nr:unnamed protein product [Rotaria sp. Silwood2]CAF4666089.1 unnamed protein product [Rotaria sp. Silwood2]
MLISILNFIFIVTLFYSEPADCVIITFDPQPIRFTLADLPPPYATSYVVVHPKPIPVPDDRQLFIPKGFSIKLSMSSLQDPRYLEYTPIGDILVIESAIDRISSLLDTNYDGFHDQRIIIANETNGLLIPSGIAFANEYLYSGNQYNIRRYKWENCHQQLSGTDEVVMNHTGIHHISRTIVIPATNDHMYVAIGSASNVDIDSLRLASIQIASLDGSNQRTFASSLRNAVGLVFHPITNDLYATCQERDELGDELVPNFVHVYSGK